jgi:ABC-type lipoprotein export system ATPase subunit
VVDIFQGPSLLPPLTVLENARFPLALSGMADREATEVARAALARFDLDRLADKLPEELSGGQAQRVASVRAVVARPALVLADEPTGQLDSATARQTLDRLLSVLDEQDAALVLSTHDPRIAERFDAVWSMRDGALRADEAEDLTTTGGASERATAEAN